MSPDPVSEFLLSAEQSGLLSVAVAATLSRELCGNGSTTKQDAAARLVEKQLLTPFQAEQILAGRGGECVLAGRYFIRQKLGEGAMGAVYLADDKKLDRPVAIKVLPAHSVTDAGAVARFQREAKALAKLSHPNIVQAHDSGEDAGRHFLVMEYAEGTNLGDLLRTKGRLAPARAADYIYQAALGLQSAHEKGLVHRDIKPHNLILCQCNAKSRELRVESRESPASTSPQATPHSQLASLDSQLSSLDSPLVKILDLGLARFLQDHVGDASLTREGTGMGTPDYMPPEQFHDARHVDARSDIYSLGCTLYHLIAGQVPFPGTSMTEKYAAHEQQTPPPLADFSPEVPAGLALAVARMMAKRPADRFQSARDVAEALFPHVSDSSHSILQVKATASWHGSQLGLSVVPLRVRRRRRIVAGSSTTGILLAVLLLAFWASGAFRGGSPPDDNVLTVAQDGSGQFKSINEALAKVDRPGMTIRVLDDATYAESLTFNVPERHAGLVVESLKQATILLTTESPRAVTIQNVPRLVVRGFRFRDSLAGERPSLFVFVTGRAAGVVIEDLDIETKKSNIGGVLLQNLRIAADEPPLMVRRCSFNVGSDAISVIGSGESAGGPTRAALVCDNRVRTALRGILVQGRVADVHIVGNMLRNCFQAAIQLQDLPPDSRGLLVANNTASTGTMLFRLWDELPHQKPEQHQAEVSNNLFFDSVVGDAVYLAPIQPGIPAPGDVAEIARQWRFANNWRDRSGSEPAYLIPLSETDRPINSTNPVDVKSNEPTSVDYLRPRAGSGLAAGGVGASDPSLPTYVGALPPEGATPWDWQKTWAARLAMAPLTVSKDPQDGGRFRSIGEALAKVDRPDMTIRVVDSKVYEESLEIRDRDRQAGLTIESPHQAKLAIPKDARVAVTVRNVPRLTIRGFVIEVSRSMTTGIGLTGYCPGTVFAGLEFRGMQIRTTGITLQSAVVDDGDAPIVVQECKFDGIGNGVEVVGQDLTTNQVSPLRGLLVHNNIFRGNDVAIWMLGKLNRVFIVSNRVQNFSGAGIRLGGLTEGSGQFLIANNTFRGMRNCIQISGLQQAVERVDIVNNLIAAERGLDIASQGTDSDLIRPWSVNHNWRHSRKLDDVDPVNSIWIEPVDDTILDNVEWSSTEDTSSDYLVPQNLAALAIAGAGGDLPAYVGAVPPEDVAAWDWRKTWEERHPKMLLTVSKDRKNEADFSTIGEALAKVDRPGMTIRVLDGATYNEFVEIKQRGIQDGLTLIATGGATLGYAPGGEAALLIHNVPNVTIRGLRVRIDQPMPIVVRVGGVSPGVLLKELVVDYQPKISNESPVSVIHLTDLNLSGDDLPVTVRDCTISGGTAGVVVMGLTGADQPHACRRVVICDNAISNTGFGVLLRGLASSVQITGNRVWSCEASCILLWDLSQGSSDILVANNSLKNAQRCLVVQQPAASLQGIEVRNNLFFADRAPDLAFSGPGVTLDTMAGWRIEQNWRTAPPPAADDPTAKEWIPLSPTDQVGPIRGLSPDVSGPNFLRPLADSPLATQAAVKDDPSLPKYAGALPPLGEPAWEWNMTWHKRHASAKP